MADFGGEMRFTWNSTPLVVRAKFTSDPVDVEIDGGANQDGSIYRTVKPIGYMAEPTFEDTPAGVATNLDWRAIMRGGPYNLALVEDHTKRLHTWTEASFEGKPTVDHMTGEVTGIKIRARSYRKQEV
jgi:hypothetical protein